MSIIVYNVVAGKLESGYYVYKCDVWKHELRALTMDYIIHLVDNVVAGHFDSE